MYLVSKVRPVGECQVGDEGGRRGRLRHRGRPKEGQLRLAQGARALGIALAQLLLFSPPEFVGWTAMNSQCFLIDVSTFVLLLPLLPFCMILLWP